MASLSLPGMYGWDNVPALYEAPSDHLRRMGGGLGAPFL
jgi:hypothetical protein